jgi:hypothetical protein
MMDSLLVDGDFARDVDGLKTITGADAVKQSLYFALVTPKGSFVLNRELGSELPKNLTLFKFEFARTIKRILLNYNDVFLSGVEYGTQDGRIKVRLVVLVGEETRDLDLDFAEGE